MDKTRVCRVAINILTYYPKIDFNINKNQIAELNIGIDPARYADPEK